MNKVLIGIASILFAAPVNANVMEEHRRIIDATETYVSFSVNTFYCFQRNVHGYYMRDGQVVVCQDNKEKVGQMVEWTENDYDTLRHESHHLIQDCKAGTIGDFVSEPMFEGEEYEVVINALGPKKVNDIRHTYQQSGSDERDIAMEIQAFAVATFVSPRSIAEAIHTYCSK